MGSDHEDIVLYALYTIPAIAFSDTRHMLP